MYFANYICFCRSHKNVDAYDTSAILYSWLIKKEMKKTYVRSSCGLKMYCQISIQKAYNKMSFYLSFHQNFMSQKLVVWPMPIRHKLKLFWEKEAILTFCLPVQKIIEVNSTILRNLDHLKVPIKYWSNDLDLWT